MQSGTQPEPDDEDIARLDAVADGLVFAIANECLTGDEAMAMFEQVKSDVDDEKRRRYIGRR